MTPRSSRPLPATLTPCAPAPRRPARTVKVASLALIGVLSLTGCQWTSPIQTEKQYNAADGVAANLGALEFRDLLVVSSQKDGPGTVSALVYNGGDSDAQVTIGTEGGAGSQPVTVPAGNSTQLASAQNRTQLATVPVPPGALINLTLSSAAGNTVVQVPVLLDQGEYATLKPTGPATPQPGPNTMVPVPSGTEGAPTQGATTPTAPPQTAPVTPEPSSTTPSG